MNLLHAPPCIHVMLHHPHAPTTPGSTTIPASTCFPDCTHPSNAPPFLHYRISARSSCWPCNWHPLPHHHDYSRGSRHEIAHCISNSPVCFGGCLGNSRDEPGERGLSAQPFPGRSRTILDKGCAPSPCMGLTTECHATGARRGRRRNCSGLREGTWSQEDETHDPQENIGPSLHRVD